MSIASLSLTFVQYNSTADFARPQAAAAPRPATGAATPAPAPAPAAAAPASCQHTCDSPRRSPLYRALMDALGSLVPSAPSALAGGPVAPPAPPAPATAPAADAATADAAPDLDEAVMNFARALMQAVRGSGRDEGDDGERRRHHRHAHHEHGHHHAHHDHGRHAWGDPAQRIDALGARWGASPSPAPAPAPAPAVPLDPVPTTPPMALTDVTLDPVAATDVAPATAAPTLPPPLPAPSSDTVAPRRDRYGLLDAFSALQRALGLPVAEGRAGLETQLGAFLQTLAARLRGGDADSATATTLPGALLNVTA